MTRSPPRTMMVVMVIMMLLAASCPGRCESPVEYPLDYDGEDGCHPEEADHCFADVNTNLMCNLAKSNQGNNCANRDALDLCNGMNDALACSEDILDTCTEGEGHETFEVWLTGLRGVYLHLCQLDENMELLTVLLKGSKCFRLKRFINCVEDRANLTHMADLLTTDLDLFECNKILIAVAACTEDSEKNRRQCQGTSKAVMEALTAFFTSTECGQVLPPLPSSSPPCPSSTAPDSIGNNTSSSNNNDNISPTSTSGTTTTTTNTNDTSKDKNKTTTTTTTSTSSPRSDTTTSTSANTSKAVPQVACQDLKTSGAPSASTVVVTVLVTLVLVGLAAMLLLKKGILVIRTDLDRRLIGLNDGDGNSAYDRF